MGATAAQIASAKALAKSRGYDPNLVDADNADRANTAFPVKGGGSGGGGSTPQTTVQAPPPVDKAANPGPTNPSAPDAGGGGGAGGAGGAGGGSGGGTALDLSASTGLAAKPQSSGAPLDGLMSAAPGPGAGAAVMQPSLGTGLRAGLGNRQYPQESYVVAGLKRAY